VAKSERPGKPPWNDEEEAEPEEAPREAANPAGLLYPWPPSWNDAKRGETEIEANVQTLRLQKYLECLR
jgi:hypothetical protein